MKGEILLFTLLFAVSILALEARHGSRCKQQQQYWWWEQMMKGSRTGRILQSLGYTAREHNVSTQNGKYTLSLVQVTNPLISGGKYRASKPLLFVHGFTSNANTFIAIRDKVMPQDYSEYDISSMSDDELFDVIGEEQGSYSLVFTALNFGYEVWLLNRRPTLDSRWAHLRYLNGKSNVHPTKSLFGSTTVDKDYYNFSFDEQAKYDLPTIIDYILEQTAKKQVVIVAYSAGTAITQMALAEKPSLSDKIAKALLWGPVLDMGKGIMDGVLDDIFKHAFNIDRETPGPFPPSDYWVAVIEDRASTSCKTRGTRSCYAGIEGTRGKGAEQLEVKYVGTEAISEFLSGDTGSNFERNQFYQSYARLHMHHYDYGNDFMNLQKYGQVKPPIYNVSRITSKALSYWLGNTDKLAREDNLLMTLNRLKVPYEFHKLDGEGVVLDRINGEKVKFNHLAFELHKEITRLLIIPSLKTIALQDSTTSDTCRSSKSQRLDDSKHLSPYMKPLMRSIFCDPRTLKKYPKDELIGFISEIFCDD